MSLSVGGVLVGERVQHRLEGLLECHALVALVVGEGEVVEDVADILARVEAVLVAQRYGGEGDVGHGLGEALDDGDAGLQLPILYLGQFQLYWYFW